MGTRAKYRWFRDQHGAVAVEFALITPVMFLLCFGIIAFSIVLSTYAALQQIAAEAARASLSGLTSTQQSQYASQYITGVIGNYPFIDPNFLTVTTAAGQTTFEVTLSYNAGSSYFSNFASSLVSSPIILTRSATVQLSGF